MTGFGEKLRLKGMAEEDIYFARKDRELIASLQRKRSASASVGTGSSQGKRVAENTAAHQPVPGRIRQFLATCRKLVARILAS